MEESKQKAKTKRASKAAADASHPRASKEAVNTVGPGPQLEGAKPSAVLQQALQDSQALQQGPSQALQEGPSQALQEGANGALQEGPSQALQEGPSGALQEGPSGAQEEPSKTLQEGPSGALQEGPSQALQEGASAGEMKDTTKKPAKNPEIAKARNRQKALENLQIVVKDPGLVDCRPDMAKNADFDWGKFRQLSLC